MLRDSTPRPLPARSHNANDRDVILLTEVLRGLGDRCGGLIADLLGAGETEQFPLLIGGFDDAIGNKREPVAGFQLKAHHGKFRTRCRSQRERAFHRHFFAIHIRRQMSGVRQGRRAIRRNAQRQAGRIGLAAAEQAAIQRLQQAQWIKACLRLVADGAYKQETSMAACNP